MLKTSSLKNSHIGYLLIFFGIFFSLGIGSIHLFDLDELYFAEITREMMLTKKYGQVSFNFQPLYEKPPLFFWIQAASMQLWGINEVGARFPNTVCGLLTISTLYYIGKQYKESLFGFLWMCLHATTFLPHFYFKSGIIDPFLNYFMLVAIYLLSRNTIGPPHLSKHIYCAGIAIGLALLIKGPMGVVIPFATVALARTWVVGYVISWKKWALTLLIATIVVCCWIIAEIWHHGFIFIKEFWDYHLLLYHEPVDTHHQPWYYHYVVLFFGCFPSSLFSIYFLKQKGLIRINYFAANMQALLVVVLLIFTCVGTKIAHYSSMAYFPITFFSANFLYDLICRDDKASKVVNYLLAFVSVFIGCFLLTIPSVIQHKELFLPFIKNQQVSAALNTPVAWHYGDSLPGLLYLIGSLSACYYFSQRRFIAFISMSMCINMLSLTLFLMRIAPKIESYSQKEIINFCKEHKNKDVYLVTVGFKAAAPLFYMDKQPERSFKERDLLWLLEGSIDKSCLFILYKNEASFIKDYENITHIKDSGCFSFYQRIPSHV
ncbi:ArnT family glycosyltransferase [Cardinium endosymbiont of Tipula unca]|uniref:ArnT family glycosyltransferase n=1 Tax=Cardinium endosymbiont of Tipula unca TaxID=3066216 RepID=UPI0030CE6740